MVRGRGWKGDSGGPVLMKDQDKNHILVGMIEGGIKKYV